MGRQRCCSSLCTAHQLGGSKQSDSVFRHFCAFLWGRAGACSRGRWLSAPAARHSAYQRAEAAPHRALQLRSPPALRRPRRDGVRQGPLAAAPARQHSGAACPLLAFRRRSPAIQLSPGSVLSPPPIAPLTALLHPVTATHRGSGRAYRHRLGLNSKIRLFWRSVYWRTDRVKRCPLLPAVPVRYHPGTAAFHWTANSPPSPLRTRGARCPHSPRKELWNEETALLLTPLHRSNSVLFTFRKF